MNVSSSESSRPVSNRFRKDERLHGKRDFAAVYEHRNSGAGKLIIVYGKPNELDRNRLGISVGQRYGTAVARNHFGRLCRESFRLSKARQPHGFDWIVLPRLPRKSKIHKKNIPPEKLKLEELQPEMLEQMWHIAHRESKRQSEECGLRNADCGMRTKNVDE